MREEKRIISLLLVIFLFVAGFSGCSKKAELKKQAAGKITITYGTFESTPEAKRAIENIITSFEAEYPNIIVKPTYNASPQKILIQMAGGTAPDVFYFHPFWIAEFASRGTLLDITSLVKKDKELNLKKYFPPAIESCFFKGKMYGLPVQVNTNLLFYNKRIFDQDGLPYPDDSWTLKDLLHAAQKITKEANGDGRTGQIGIIKPDWRLMIHLNGGKLFGLGRKRSLLESPRVKAAVQFWVNLNLKYHVTSPGLNPYRLSLGGARVFASNRLGMMFGGTYMVRILRKVPGLKWDVAPLPKSLDGSYRLKQPVYAMLNVIYAKTKHPRAAFEFLKYYSGKQGEEYEAKLRNGIPPLREIAYSPAFLSPPPEHMALFLKALENSVPVPNWTGKNELYNKIIKPGFDEMWFGSVGVKEELKKLNSKVNEFLRKQEQK